MELGKACLVWADPLFKDCQEMISLLSSREQVLVEDVKLLEERLSALREDLEELELEEPVKESNVPADLFEDILEMPKSKNDLNLVVGANGSTGVSTFAPNTGLIK
jgi:hypothetical protein